MSRRLQSIRANSPCKAAKHKWYLITPVDGCWPWKQTDLTKLVRCNHGALRCRFAGSAAKQQQRAAGQCLDGHRDSPKFRLPATFASSQRIAATQANLSLQMQRKIQDKLPQNNLLRAVGHHGYPLLQDMKMITQAVLFVLSSKNLLPEVTSFHFRKSTHAPLRMTSCA